MKIVPITKTNMEAFSPLIPQEYLRQRVVLLGAMEEMTGCGLVAFETLADRCIIDWLWVAPEWRERGIGAALLDAACAQAFSRREHVQLCYKASMEGCERFDLMLMRRGFLMQNRDVLRCEVTGEALLNSPLMKHAKVKKQTGVRFVPLAQVDAYVIRAGAALCEEHGDYQASRADYAGADWERSMALLVETKMKGCVLLRNTGTAGCYELTMFYLDASCVVLGVPFLRACVQHLMKFPEGVQSIRILAASERTKKIVTKLLGDAEFQKEQAHEAHLYREKVLSGE